MLMHMSDVEFWREAIRLIDEKHIGNNVIEARTEGLAKLNPKRYQKIWASEITGLRKAARTGMNPKKVRALERVLGVAEGTLGNLLGFSPAPLTVDEEKSEDIVIAEALHVDPDIWESLTGEEKEFILRDAREKAEFFRKRK